MSPYFHCACYPHHVCTVLPLPPSIPFGENLVDGGRIPRSSKKNAHFPYQKKTPHQTAFSCNYPIQASIIAAVIITVSFFLTSGLIYRCIMLISWWFLSLICGLTKAVNDQNSSNQNSQPPYPPSNAIWETLLQLLLVFFIPSLFYFKLYKFLLTPFQLWLHSLQAN